MLLPITNVEQTLSRNFHQEQDGTISVNIRWQINLMTSKQAVKMLVQNLATNATNEYLLEQNDLRHSSLKLNLVKGNFKITLTNITGRGILAINFIQSKGKKIVN